MNDPSIYLSGLCCAATKEVAFLIGPNFPDFGSNVLVPVGGAHEAIIDRDIWDTVQAQLKRNASSRINGKNARSPGLLTGLLQHGNGDRLTPSHASKQGKRYRYYISAPGEDGKPGADWRLPAAEVDSAVIDGVVSLLRDRLRLIRGLGLPDARPDQIESLFAKAEEFAATLSEAGTSETRELLLKITNRIEIGLDRIRIEIVTVALLEFLGHTDPSDTPERIITIDMAVKLRRRGVEKKIIITSGNQPSTNPDANLIKVIAQGRHWFEQLKSGEFGTVRKIAKHYETDGENVTRTIRLAFLAPDIVETILYGRQPPHLTAFQLKRVRNLPLSWDAQRQMLEFQA